ncbi:G-protein coupled receptor Mth2 isoform X1 [Stomoxys calcitrans]|uniref:G-protein coupled receptor Mth2 isoform X1 n=1 Tax=Stomoxys calcitrans TaxID=35570 RepID=UPI0027E36444|nr:G-protein coupled receptor Mth2 isoform X1 [Stomoxys calcitrans]
MYSLRAFIITFSLLSTFCELSQSLEIFFARDLPLTIRLCCRPSEFFNVTSNECETIPNDFHNTTWEISNFWSDGNATKVNLLQDLTPEVVAVNCQEPYVYGFFEYSNDSDYCYTPHYHMQLQKYIIATIDCASLIHVYSYIYDSYLFGIGFSSLFLLLTIVIYGIFKELRHTLNWKLFIFNFVSWILAHTFVILSVRLMCVELVLYALIFFISSRLWLSVIGYDTWLIYVSNFREYDLKELDRKRLLVYTMCVWGVAILASFSSWFLRGSTPMDNWVSLIPIEFILCMALMSFAYFVYELFSIRKSVRNTRAGKHFIRNSISTILFLIYMSILPWVIMLLWLLNKNDISMAITFYIYLIIEGPIIFAIYVPVRKLRYLWKNRKPGRNSLWLETNILKGSKSTYV